MNNDETCSRCAYWAPNAVRTIGCCGELAIVDYVDGLAAAPCGFIRGDYVALVTSRPPDDDFGQAQLNWKASIATIETFGCNQFEVKITEGA